MALYRDIIEDLFDETCLGSIKRRTVLSKQGKHEHIVGLNSLRESLCERYKMLNPNNKQMPAYLAPNFFCNCFPSYAVPGKRRFEPDASSLSCIVVKQGSEKEPDFAELKATLARLVKVGAGPTANPGTTPLVICSMQLVFSR